MAIIFRRCKKTGAISPSTRSVSTLVTRVSNKNWINKWIKRCRFVRCVPTKPEASGTCVSRAVTSQAFLNALSCARSKL